MRKLLKLFCMPAIDRYLLMGTWLLLGTIRLALWALPFRRVHYICTRVVPRGIVSSESILIGKISWAVDVSSHVMPGVKCLARALTAYCVLRFAGHVSSIQFGVAPAPNRKLEAHAWVESQGRIVTGYLVDLNRYTPLPALDEHIV